MEGKFTKKLSPILAAMLILGAAALIMVPVKLNQWPDVTPQFYTMAMVLWGLFLAGFLAFGAGMLLANRGAFLKLSETGISAKYGFGTRLECSLQDINYIAMGPAMLTLEVDGKIHDIGNLENVGEIVGWLKQQLPFVVPRESREDLLAQRAQDKVRRKKWLIATIVALAMMFLEIALMAWATDGGELHHFQGRDVIIFYIFVAAEIVTLVAAFRCAGRAGKFVRSMAVNHDKLRCKLLATVPLPLGDAIGVFYDGSQRLTLYADPEDRIYYITQNMTANYTLQVSGECEPTHDTAQIDKKIDAMRDIGFLFGME